MEVQVTAILAEKPKVAFYPCCGEDFLCPVRVLKDKVDKIVFCDIKSEREQAFFEFIQSRKCTEGLDIEFLCADAKQVIDAMESLDVLFYRCDSMGEGGSGLGIFSERFFLKIVEKLSKGLGLIITDGSTCWPKTFEKMVRPQGTRRYGWRVKPVDHSPVKTSRGELWTFSVHYEGEE